MNAVSHIRGHYRGKPGRSAAYVQTHQALMADVVVLQTRRHQQFVLSQMADELERLVQDDVFASTLGGLDL